MTSLQCKGVKILKKEQHEELLANGYYTLADGTRVEEDKNFFYASKETVNLDELANAVKANTKSIEDILSSSYQTKEDETLATESKNIVGAINEINNSIGDINTVLEEILGV